MGKEVFLRRPPPSFDCDFAGDERGMSPDTDEDWLPDVKDIFSGNFHFMIDMTGDSDSEEDDESSSRYPRSESGGDPATAKPTRSQLSLRGERPLWVCQPLQAVNRIDFERAEIPESPVAIPGCSTVNVSSRHSSNGDSGGGTAATTATTDAVAAYNSKGAC